MTMMTMAMMIVFDGFDDGVDVFYGFDDDDDDDGGGEPGRSAVLSI